MSRKHLLSAAAALVLAGFAAGAANASAFQNGGFEAGAYVDQGSGADTFLAGNTTITGWTVGGVGGISWDLNGSFSITGDEGTHFLDLTGYCDAQCGGYGGLSQTFDTVNHATYKVTFDLGSQLDYDPVGSGVAVTAGAFSGSFTNLDAPDNDDTDWKAETFTFTAQGGSSTLSFEGNLGAQFVGLDNVSVSCIRDCTVGTPGVPEPASWALMILGFGGVGVMLRNHRKAVLAAV